MNVHACYPQVAILGGGVAGMGCALWLYHLGMTPLLFERGARLGGQLCGLPRVNRWVLGFPDTTSVELAARYAAHIEQSGITVYFQQTLHAVDQRSRGYALHFRDEAGRPNLVNAAALVIATGTRVVGAEIFGENCDDVSGLYERGQIGFHPLDHLENLASLHGLNVAVIGGGDNAHHTADDIAHHAAQVYLLMRSTAKAQPAIRQRIEKWVAQNKIHEYRHTAVCGIDRDDCTETLRLRTSSGWVLNVHRVFVRAGFRPNTDFLAVTPGLQTLACDRDGYLCTDHGKRTNLPSIYAIGDVTHPSYPAVVTALADGAIAARAISTDLIWQ